MSSAMMVVFLFHCCPLLRHRRLARQERPDQRGGLVPYSDHRRAVDDAAVLRPLGDRGVSFAGDPELAADSSSRGSSDWPCRCCSGSSSSSRPTRSTWSGSATASTPAPSGVSTRTTSTAGTASGGNFAWMGLHLWYLEVLFVFSVLALPLFLVLRSPYGRSTLRPLCHDNESPRHDLPPGDPHRPHGVLRQLGGPHECRQRLLPPARLRRLEPPAVSRDLRSRLSSCRRQGNDPGDGEASLRRTLSWPSPHSASATFSSRREACRKSSMGFALVRGVLCWSCLIAICGFASRRLRFSNRFLKYANDAVLPFYILHQTVILGHWLPRDPARHSPLAAIPRSSSPVRSSSPSLCTNCSSGG